MKRQATRSALLAAALGLALTLPLQFGCEEPDPVGADGLPGSGEDPADNVPPVTHLTLNPDSGRWPASSTSRTTVSWWGEDVDGRVVAYRYRWGRLIGDTTGQIPDTADMELDTSWYDVKASWTVTERGDSLLRHEFTEIGDAERWIETTKEEIEFVLPIRTAFATFLVQVRAVDNHGGVSEAAAEVAFPVVNSPPNIEFRIASNPDAFADTTYYSFPVRSFVWDATDPDGNETIASIEYALDDTSEWDQVDGSASLVTLRDIPAGDHTFYARARDVAGFLSPVIQFPDTSEQLDPARWTVKEPAPGGYLIVKDFADEPLGNPNADNYNLGHYQQVFETLYGAEDQAYSVWDVSEAIPYVTSDIRETLFMFDRILWYSLYGTPKLTEAFNAVYGFINSAEDRRLLLTTMTVVDRDPGVHDGMVLDLVDSLYNATPWHNRLIPTDTYDPPDPVIAEPVDNPELPSLRLRVTVGRFVFGLVPSDEAEVLYQLDETTAMVDQPGPQGPHVQYEGNPVIGVRRPDKSYTLISVPVRNFVENDATPEQYQQLEALIANTFGTGGAR